MKKMIILAIGLMFAIGNVMAGPHGGHQGGHTGGGYRPAPAMHHGGGHHNDSFWGRGGRNFWPGFIGGVVGGAMVNPAPIVTTPVVITPVVTTPIVSTPIVNQQVVVTPQYITQQVWVEGRYIDQVQRNGTIVRIWQPGHYETQQIRVN